MSCGYSHNFTNAQSELKLAYMLDPDFRFSQHSLNDFAECPHRFYLRYIAKQSWPLLETGPGAMEALTYQAYLRRGVILHRWIERHWLGMNGAPQSPPTTVADAADSDEMELSLWWQRFSSADLAGLPPLRLPELALVAPLGDALLYARFDLLALPSDNNHATGHNSDIVIVDWKTLRGNAAPGERFFRNRLQTRIYLYVLATAGAPFNGGQPIAPERCRMRYWLANFPDRPWVEIGYSQAEYEADARQLSALVSDALSRRRRDAFERTANEAHCQYCNYRTLCQRQPIAGFAPPDESPALIDLETIPTLDY